MSHDDKNNFGGNDSIFNDSSSFQQGFTNPVENIPNIPAQQSSVGEFFDKLIAKITGKSPEDNVEFQNQLIKLAKDNEDVFEVFNQFGCKLEYKNGVINVHCPQIKLVGKITITKDNKAEFDEDMKKIMTHLARLVSSTNSLTVVINEYERQGFYPVGEMVKETVVYQGGSVEALSGTLQHKNGETKKIYFYKGIEITPDE